MARLARNIFGITLAAASLLSLGCVATPEDIAAAEAELLTPNITAYPTTGGVVVDYTGMAGGANNWISIAPVGAPINGYVAWRATTGTAGSIVIPNVPEGGPYEARAHYDQTVGTIRQTSAPFSVSSGATLTPDSGTYVDGTAIVVTFAGVPAATNTWFSMAPQGSTNTTLTSFVWNTAGVASGTFTFYAPPTPGNYVLRCFRNGTYNRVTESAPFAVTAYAGTATVTPPPIVEPGAPIVVAYDGFLNSGADRVAIANVGAPGNEILANVSPVTGASGTATFYITLAPGTYEARGYFNWNAASQRYVIRASATFVVAASLTRVSVSSSDAEGNGPSEVASVSDDGRYVAFASTATNLAAGDTNGRADIFLRDRTTGTTTLVSVDSSGTISNGTSAKPRISDDGRYVVFSSRGTNLLATGTDVNATNLDIFVHDTVTGTTSCASVNAAGDTGNGEAYYPDITPDGRYVVFHSSSTDLVPGDTNGVWDVFLRDMQSGTTERISLSDTGAELDRQSLFARVSDDAQYVSFVSHATNIVAGRTVSYFEVFIRDRVAATTTRVTTLATGEVNADSYSVPEITSNGRFVVYASWASNIVAGDTNGVYDLFRWDRLNGTTIRVNLADDESEANAQVLTEGFAVSEDGRYVAFASAASNLVTGDGNGTADVFRRDIPLAATVRISAPAGGGDAAGTSRRPLLSSDGRRIVFESDAANLASGDANGLYDVFARYL